MEQEKLHQLLEKYHAGRCSDAELEALQQWYESLGGAPEAPHWDVTDDVYLRDHYAAFQQRARLQPVTHRRTWKKVAAAAAVITVCGLLTRYFYPLPATDTRQPVAAATVQEALRPPAPEEVVNYDRHLVLPDSSVVLLRAGSSLQLSAAFDQADRLVTLQGEAYFDIRRNARHPFIVRCANVYTYVLGTAFNINTAGKDRQVTITVTSGKVRVEREHKTVAVLTKNQALTFRDHQQPIPATLENVTPTVEWMAKDLLFNETSLETICQRLSARYQVHFTFERQVNKEKRVTITDAFYGTESLNDILDIVCTTLGYTYSVTGTTVTVTTQ